MQRSSSRIRSGGGAGGGGPSRSRGVDKAKANNTKRPCAEVSPNLLSKSINAVAMPVSDPKPVKPFDRRSPPSKTTPFHEKRATRIAEMQLQIHELQEELRREKEDKAKAKEELAQTKINLSLSLSTPPPPISLKDTMDQVEIWEREIERAKESERNMLESLIFQTKQLEQTKISLEEAKLEIRSLKSREEEVETLKLRARSAVESEEKSKKAIDDLATALNDVSEEAKQVKTWLSETESELVKTKSQLEAATVSLKTTEERLKLELDEIERFKFEKEESAIAWNEKEKLFLSCMKESESEINRGKQENLKLIESQRVIREENARLREMLKQAVNEAASLKETLAAERDENSRLKESISEKEQAFQTVKQDFECLKISERSARDSLKELENMLESNPTPTKSPPKNPCPKIDEEREEEERYDPKPQTIRDRRQSIGAPSKFNRFSESERFDPFVGSARKDRVFASLSNIADMKAASRVVVQELGEEYDYIDHAYLVDGDQHAKHKKKPILRRFGNIFKRKSVGY